jgi:small GTP-binding protein
MSAPLEGSGKKLVFIGDPGVGKTCIISRFLKGTFDADQITTVGASYASKTIKISETNESLTLDIWDTAGQEKYRSLTRIFFQGAKLAILVYDITRKDSFENLKNVWLKELKDHADKNVVLGVAGNKSDLYEKEEVPEQEAREFAKSIGAIFCLTSAQNNSGIEELFEEMGKKFLDPNSTINESENQNLDQAHKQKKDEKKKEKKEEQKNIQLKNVKKKEKKNCC